jgi:hypothetical protein
MSSGDLKSCGVCFLLFCLAIVLVFVCLHIVSKMFGMQVHHDHLLCWPSSDKHHDSIASTVHRVPPRIRLGYAVRDAGKDKPADSRPEIPHRVDDVEIDICRGVCGCQSEIGLHPSSSEQIAPHTVQGARRSARSDKETHDIFSTSSIISDVTHRLHATNETRPGMAFRPHRPPRYRPAKAVANPCPKCSAASCAYSLPARPTPCASAGGCPARRRVMRSACAVAPA